MDSSYSCHRFASEMIEIYIISNISPLIIFKDRPRPLTNFCDRPSLSSCPGQSSFSGVLISPIAPKALWHICVDHILLWIVAVWKLPSQTKVANMPSLGFSDHRYSRHMLTNSPQNWNHHFWAHAILDGESRVSLYQSDDRAHVPSASWTQQSTILLTKRWQTQAGLRKLQRKRWTSQ